MITAELGTIRACDIPSEHAWNDALYRTQFFNPSQRLDDLGIEIIRNPFDEEDITWYAVTGSMLLAAIAARFGPGTQIFFSEAVMDEEKAWEAIENAGRYNDQYGLLEITNLAVDCLSGNFGPYEEEVMYPYAEDGYKRAMTGQDVTFYLSSSS